ncbi:hypothetical protein GCM10020255_102240 [Rhodococcus baikonurensis]
MTEILDEAVQGLAPLVGPDDANLIVVADRHGRILWRRGPSRMLDRAERLGMIEGASWTEEAVGTNGIGTSLASGSAVQVFSAEHYSRSQHPWTCSGRRFGIRVAAGPSPSSTSPAQQTQFTRRLSHWWTAWPGWRNPHCGRNIESDWISSG